jgi:myosin-1
MAKFSNEITDDLRDIVSQLLVHEDERPTPDQIVNHPYFRLGYIPLTLDTSCTSHVPKWPKIRPPSASTIRRGYTEEWFALCKSSSVGEYEAGKTFGAYGSRRNKTVARDCQKEIESGKQPNIPFAKDTVYLPFPERTHWPFQAAAGLSEITEEKESSSEGLALLETAANDRAKGRLPRIRRREEPMPTLKENEDPEQDNEPTRRTTNKPPTRMRSVRKISNPGRVTASTATTVPLRVPKETRTVQRTKSTDDASRDLAPVQIPPLRTSKSAPTGSNEMPPPPKVQQPTTKKSPLLRSVSPELPSTDPASVLAQLRAFRDNVARALEKKPLRSRHTDPPQLPFVSKWVDYSRKHGVGFVLDDGTVGCLVAGKDKHPVTTAFVKNGHYHLNKVNEDMAYLAKIPIEYYAACGEQDGISRMEVLDKHRREHLRVIWHKFARYMCSQLGNDDRPSKRIPSESNFVKFYQRLGNVGFWGFGDNSIQVRGT